MGVVRRSIESLVHGPLRTRIPAQIAPRVYESRFRVGRQPCRIAFVNGKHDAGLPATQPGRQLARFLHCGPRRQGTEPRPPWLPESIRNPLNNHTDSSSGQPASLAAPD